MKRLGLILVLFVCLVSLFLPAMAANSAQQANADATVNTDGSCHICLQLRLQLDGAEVLTYPLPGNARDIMVNGQSVASRKEGDRIFLTLPVSGPGTVTLTVEYTLEQAVNTKKGLLTLPLLSGFSLPIQKLEFSVTLPGKPTEEPVYTSGYHQQQIGRQIQTSLDGNTLRGQVNTLLKDHETLLLELPVESDWFSVAAGGLRLPTRWVLAMLGCILLAVLYFCLTLLPRIPRYERCCSPPEGISAGEVGTCLAGCGTDLTLLVITWAQLGYLSLEPDTRGRVLLHKRMQMGNERSAAENRHFQQLFGSKTVIDGTGYHYAQLYRKIATKAPLMPMLFSPRSGSSRIFRAICCLAGIFSGIRMGLSLDMGLGARTLMVLLLSGLTALLSYLIQSGGKCLPLRNKTPLWTALGCGAAWILLGMLTDFTAMAVAMVLFQFAAGMCAAYGGKRSELGKRSLARLLGLRSHMVSAKTFDLQQLMQKNPNYFYELAPYALAMGIDRKFARHFGKTPLPEDSFLNLGHHKNMTAAQWAAQLRRIADTLNKRQKRLPYEWLIGK